MIQGQIQDLGVGPTEWWGDPGVDHGFGQGAMPLVGEELQH